jgi:hypothetical protein
MWAGSVAQVVEYLPSKHEALNPIIAKNKLKYSIVIKNKQMDKKTL